ncbi:hypothetical protein BHS04_10830 [Myxococcus xanthus]|nr:hypothetical protein BHS04_10830 [Myxococcus xanthus]
MHTARPQETSWRGRAYGPVNRLRVKGVRSQVPPGMAIWHEAVAVEGTPLVLLMVTEPTARVLVDCVPVHSGHWLVPTT